VPEFSEAMNSEYRPKALIDNLSWEATSDVKARHVAQMNVCATLGSAIQRQGLR
jgi:hypothetical protein